MPQAKLLYKVLSYLYLLTLLWLVLFKLSFDIPSVLFDHQMRSLNLIPFIGSSRGEMFSNIIIFIPFGLLLSVNLKRITFLRKLAVIFIFSLAVEVSQFIFAIGVTDITDVITNTLGGFIGLMLYTLSTTHIESKKLDRFIIVATALLLILFILLRCLALKIRY